MLPSATDKQIYQFCIINHGERMRKVVVIGVILLFNGMSISSSTGFNLEEQSNGDVITVDNEGDGDYTSIKQALNNSNPGDTIEVYSGTYPEQEIRIVNDNIKLLGISHELGEGDDSENLLLTGVEQNQSL